MTYLNQDWLKVPISEGAHKKRMDGVCALEMVAWMAGEPHSDHPECVSSVIATFIRNWNDDLRTDEERELLRPVLPTIIGSVGSPGEEHHRMRMCAGFVVNTQVSAWLKTMPSMVRHVAELERHRLNNDRLDIIFEAMLDIKSGYLEPLDQYPVESLARTAVKASGFDAAFKSCMWFLYDGVNGGMIRTIVNEAAQLALVEGVSIDVLEQTTLRLQESALYLIKQMYGGAYKNLSV